MRRKKRKVEPAIPYDRCDATGKRRYLKESDANRALFRTMINTRSYLRRAGERAARLHTYYCLDCGGYHVGQRSVLGAERDQARLAQAQV